jgi:hypothetical protein
MKVAPADFKRFLPGMVAALLIIGTTAVLLVLSLEPEEEPDAHILHDEGIVEVGRSILFDGRNSTDPEGDGLDFHWTVNGTVHIYEPFFLYSFPTPGNFSVVLKVTDASGDFDTDTVIIDVR